MKTKRKIQRGGIPGTGDYNLDTYNELKQTIETKLKENLPRPAADLEDKIVKSFQSYVEDIGNKTKEQDKFISDIKGVLSITDYRINVGSFKIILRRNDLLKDLIEGIRKNIPSSFGDSRYCTDIEVCERNKKSIERRIRGMRDGRDRHALEEELEQNETNKGKLIEEQKILDELERIITAYNKKNPHIQTKKTFEVKQYDKVSPAVYDFINSDSGSSDSSEIKDYLKCIIPYRFEKIDSTNNKLDFDVTVSGTYSDEPGVGAGLVDATGNALGQVDRDAAKAQGRGRGEIEIQNGYYNPKTLATEIVQAFAKNDLGTLNIKFNADTRKYKWNWIPSANLDGTQRNLTLTLRITNDNTNLGDMLGFEIDRSDVPPGFNLNGVKTHNPFFENDDGVLTCGRTTRNGRTYGAYYTIGSPAEKKADTTYWDGEWNQGGTGNIFTEVTVDRSDLASDQAAPTSYPRLRKEEQATDRENVAVAAEAALAALPAGDPQIAAATQLVTTRRTEATQAQVEVVDAVALDRDYRLFDLKEHGCSQIIDYLIYKTILTCHITKINGFNAEIAKKKKELKELHAKAGQKWIRRDRKLPIFGTAVDVYESRIKGSDKGLNIQVLKDNGLAERIKEIGDLFGLDNRTFINIHENPDFLEEITGQLKFSNLEKMSLKYSAKIIFERIH
jgi:hypothetical protein